MRWTFLAAILVVTIGSLAFFRIHRARDLDAYYLMIDQGHPIWKELAMRRVHQGDSAKDLLHRVPATSQVRFGRSALLLFESGGVTCTIASRDEKIVSAWMWSSTSKFSFFETNDPVLDADMSAFTKKQT
jgi:hypothetical protein